MRIIAGAQVKTDKVDAYMLATFLRAELISTVHIPIKSTRQRKEVFRQRCFFARHCAMLRERIQRLLSAQYNLQLPQCSDLSPASPNNGWQVDSSLDLEQRTLGQSAVFRSALSLMASQSGRASTSGQPHFAPTRLSSRLRAYHSFPASGLELPAA